MFDAQDDGAEKDTGQRVESGGPAPTSVLAPRFDDDRQMIFIDCDGTWTTGQVDACFDELKILTTAMRSRCNRVRVLVDRRKAVPQPPETVERLKKQTQIKYLPNDRIAVLVDSSFSKMQLREELDLQTHKMFLSSNAAITWLTAHD